MHNPSMHKLILNVYMHAIDFVPRIRGRHASCLLLHQSKPLHAALPQVQVSLVSWRLAPAFQIPIVYPLVTFTCRYFLSKVLLPNAKKATLVLVLDI